MQEKPLKFINRGLISIKGLDQPRRTFFVEPLARGEKSMTILMPIPSSLCVQGFGQHNQSFLKLDMRRATIGVPGSETGHRGLTLLQPGDELRKKSICSSEQALSTNQEEENGILFTVTDPAASQSTKQRIASLNNNQIHPEMPQDAPDDADRNQTSKRRSRRKPKCTIA